MGVDCDDGTQGVGLLGGLLMLIFVFLVLTSDPLVTFFDGYLPLPNPKPEDCIIMPLDNPKASDIIDQRVLITT